MTRHMWTLGEGRNDASGIANRDLGMAWCVNLLPSHIPGLAVCYYEPCVAALVMPVPWDRYGTLWTEATFPKPFRCDLTSRER